MDSILGCSIKKIRTSFQFVFDRCRKLPRALKDWQAFQDLRTTIDDFNESCPLLELMANKAMKLRHWDRIAQVTGHTFDVESETFALRNIMEAPLLKHKEDIEVLGVIIKFRSYFSLDVELLSSCVCIPRISA